MHIFAALASALLFLSSLSLAVSDAAWAARADAAAPAPAITRRGAGSRAACRRRHQRPTWPLRIGVSMTRNDTSVTTAVIASADTNWAIDRGLPATRRMIW